LNNKVGSKYDFKGCLSFIGRFFRQDPIKYFCSEYVCDAFGSVGIFLVNKESGKVSPSELAKSSKLVLIEKDIKL